MSTILPGWPAPRFERAPVTTDDSSMRIAIRLLEYRASQGERVTISSAMARLVAQQLRQLTREG